MRGAVAAALLGALCACSIPDLDRAGNIRCGAEGECPDAYQCRLGRCCPASSPLNACPALPRAAVGAPCAVTSARPPFGACPVEVGSGTETGLCYPYPQGYCTRTGCDVANGAAVCGAFGACVPLNGTNTCLRACYFDASPAPCRDAAGEVPEGGASRYTCIKDPLSRDPHAGLCIPDCTQIPGLCGAGMTCDASTRTCVATDCRATAGACDALGRYCNTATGRCAACNELPTSPCRAPQTCNAATGRCMQACVPPGLLCPAGTRCRSGFCQ